jgi:hypothetical protein
LLSEHIEGDGAIAFREFTFGFRGDRIEAPGFSVQTRPSP